jgi:cysteine desulfurase/selenocysteine lyase
MIVDVTFEKTTYQAAPGRFEAGTGNIADAVGLGAALDYVEQVGMESIAVYEHGLLIYATAGLLTVPGLKLIGTAREKAGGLSFILDDVRTEDVGAALSQEGIAVRAGHHCAQPILRRMGVEATVRASLAFYSTCEDVDALISALLRLQAGREHRKPYWAENAGIETYHRSTDDLRIVIYKTEPRLYECFPVIVGRDIRISLLQKSATFAKPKVESWSFA